VDKLRLDVNQVSQSDRNNGSENWWDKLNDIVSVLEGRDDVIQRVCENLGADWKEVCIAWGIFVDTRQRRDELPWVPLSNFEGKKKQGYPRVHPRDIAQHVAKNMPPDQTNPEDMVHFSLFSGHLEEALIHAEKLDPWLAAHLADIMEAASLINDTAADEWVCNITWTMRRNINDFLPLSPAASVSRSVIIMSFPMQKRCTQILHYGQ
jgi:nuclear pore complex protein Nup85